MLKVDNIEVVYDNVILVLRGISVEIGEGKIVAVLGANGAGKSTLLKAISGSLEPELGEVTHGNIQFDGARLDGLALSERLKLGIAHVMEGRRVLEHLTVEENLRLAASHGRSSSLSKELERVYDLFPRLKELRHNVSGYLSGGEQQMLVIGRALTACPKLILLDEPSIGLSPLLTQEIFRAINKLNKEENMAILLIEQNAQAALSIADYGYVMENGRIVLDGDAVKLRENEDVREFYLGLSSVGQRKSYHEVKHYRRRKRWLS